MLVAPGRAPVPKAVMAAAVVEAAVSGPVEVAVVGADDAERAALVQTAVALAPPGAVVVAGAPDDPGSPLLAHRPMLSGAPTAYVCRGFVCDRPVSAAEELADQLRAALEEPGPHLIAAMLRR